MPDHKKIQDILLTEINSTSTDDLTKYFEEKNIQYGVDNSGKSLGIAEQSSFRNLEKCSRILSIIRNAICYNQGELIQFTFLAAEKHKEVRLLIDSERPDKDELKEKTQALKKYLDNTIKRVINTNYNYINDYFFSRSTTLPRVCIKCKLMVEDQAKIVRLYPDKEIGYNSEINVERSTAYNHILHNGNFFLENNLPNAVKNGDYENERLNMQKINDFISNKQDIYDVWPECWKDYSNNTNDLSSYYKSTLIVPITLLNNKLDPEFTVKFNEKIDNEIGKSGLNPNEIERTIFAFLCFDHVDTWFFNDDFDVRFGYMIADLISHYLFLRTMFMEVSETFTDACDILRSYGEYFDRKNQVYAPLEKSHLHSVCSSPEEEFAKTEKNLIRQFDFSTE